MGRRKGVGGVSERGRTAVKEWQSSGLGMSQFCKQSGLSASTLSTRKKQLEQSRPPGEFVELDSGSLLELDFSSGVKVRLDSSKLSVELLRALGDAYGA
jgi:ferric-dicitrate binding protein FerR (iron transport regulator)